MSELNYTTEQGIRNAISMFGRMKALGYNRLYEEHIVWSGEEFTQAIFDLAVRRHDFLEATKYWYKDEFPLQLPFAIAIYEYGDKEPVYCDKLAIEEDELVIFDGHAQPFNVARVRDDQFHMIRLAVYMLEAQRLLTTKCKKKEWNEKAHNLLDAIVDWSTEIPFVDHITRSDIKVKKNI